MFGIGHTELLIILGICVILFGARKLPELGRGLGQGLRGFRDEMKNINSDASTDDNVARSQSSDKGATES